MMRTGWISDILLILGIALLAVSFILRYLRYRQEEKSIKQRIKSYRNGMNDKNHRNEGSYE